MEQVIWWELFDQTHKRNYYYNPANEETVWIKPKNVKIIVPQIEEDSIHSDSKEELSNNQTNSEPDDTETTILGHKFDFSEDGIFPDDESTFSETSVIVEIENEIDTFRIPSKSPLSQYCVHKAPLPPPIIDENPQIEIIVSPRVLPTSKPLLKGWEEYYDKYSDSFYYLHSSTGEKTFDRYIACGISPVTISDDEEDPSSNSIVLREYPDLQDSQTSVKLSKETSKTSITKRKRSTSGKRKHKKSSSRGRSRSKSPKSKKEVCLLFYYFIMNNFLILTSKDIKKQINIIHYGSRNVSEKILCF